MNNVSQSTLLWSSGHGYRSRGTGIDSRRYQIFRVVVLKWGSLSLLSTTEEQLQSRKLGIRP
jgi:hypothetical protein